METGGPWFPGPNQTFCPVLCHSPACACLPTVAITAARACDLVVDQQTQSRNRVAGSKPYSVPRFTPSESKQLSFLMAVSEAAAAAALTNAPAPTEAPLSLVAHVASTPHPIASVLSSTQFANCSARRASKISPDGSRDQRPPWPAKARQDVPSGAPGSQPLGAPPLVICWVPLAPHVNDFLPPSLAIISSPRLEMGFEENGQASVSAGDAHTPQTYSTYEADGRGDAQPPGHTQTRDDRVHQTHGTVPEKQNKQSCSCNAHAAAQCRHGSSKMCPTRIRLVNLCSKHG